MKAGSVSSLSKRQQHKSKVLKKSIQKDIAPKIIHDFMYHQTNAKP